MSMLVLHNFMINIQDAVTVQEMREMRTTETETSPDDEFDCASDSEELNECTRDILLRHQRWVNSFELK